MAGVISEAPTSGQAFVYGPVASVVRRVRIVLPGRRSPINVSTVAMPGYDARVYFVALDRDLARGAVSVTGLDSSGRELVTQTLRGKRRRGS
jgi:hypothetical protein